MTNKKPRKYKPGKRQYIVRSDGPIIRIEDLDKKNMLGLIKKPTLHAKGGLAGMRRFNRGGKVK